MHISFKYSSKISTIYTYLPVTGRSFTIVELKSPSDSASIVLRVSTIVIDSFPVS